MGRNCYAVGHILDTCDCSCKYRREIVGEERVIARQFKYSYFGAQHGWACKSRKKNENSEEWENEDLVCRRFLCDMRGICREESGCGRMGRCEDCFLRYRKNQ